MGNVYNSDFFFLKLTDNSKKHVCLFIRNGRCGFIQNQDLYMIGYGLGYLNQLFLGHTQLTDQCLGTYLQTDPLHVPLCLFYGTLMVHKKPLAVFLSNEYIFIYRQIRYKIKFLVNHADTGVQSLLRRHRRQLPAVKLYVPAFPSVCTGQNFN